MKRTIFWTAVAGLIITPAAWAGDDGCCGQRTVSASPCGSCKPACKTECKPCKPVCEKRCVQCCHNRTSYRLVRECTPVCREKEVCRRDACDPCNVQRTTVTECHNKTRYRWVAETRPVCHTKTVKVCHQPGSTFTNGSDDTTVRATPAKSNVQLAAAVARR